MMSPIQGKSSSQRKYFAIERRSPNEFSRTLLAVVENGKKEELMRSYFSCWEELEDGSEIFVVAASEDFFREYRRWIKGERKFCPDYVLEWKSGQYVPY